MANVAVMILGRVDATTMYLRDKVLNLRIDFVNGHVKLEVVEKLQP